MQLLLPSWRLRVLKAGLSGLGLAAIIVAIADPYYQKAITEPVYRGVRLYFLIDVSNSMKFAEDIAPNRLEAAKKEINDAYLSLSGSYEAALIPFAGEASNYYFPPSNSQIAFLDALRDLDTNLIEAPGTDLVVAFVGLNQMVGHFGHDKEAVNLAILLSDGGKEESFSVNRVDLEKSVRSLTKIGFRCYAFGVGGEKPAPLVKREFDGTFAGYVQDKNRTVYSLLDKDILKKVAEDWGNGEYVPFGKGGELATRLKEIVEKNRQVKEIKTRYEKTSLRIWFLVSAVLIFLVVGERRRR